MSTSRTSSGGTNSNDARADPPLLDLSSVGDGRAFYRSLARIIVRREMISAAVIPDPDGCDTRPNAP